MKSNTRAENRSDAEAVSAEQAKPLASWYTPGLSDPIGDRLLMFDNSGAPSLELLRFRPELGQAPGFEDALREQVERLKDLQHPAFAQVRSVQRLEPDDDLALVSNYTEGRRLSEVLQQSRGPEHAAALIRQLAPALLMLQQQGAGSSHGLLSPDRIVVSPEGRLTIVEHVIGPAIDALGLTPKDLEALGIVLPPSADGDAPRLDAATDWYQLGLVALSVLIGRPVTSDDLPQLAALVESTEEAAAGDAATAPPAVREWLERALQISGPRIAAGSEAPKVLKAVTSNDELRTKNEERSGENEQQGTKSAKRTRTAAERLSPFELSMLEANKQTPQVRTLFGTGTAAAATAPPTPVAKPKVEAPAAPVEARDPRVRLFAAAAAVLAVVAAAEAFALLSMARALWGTPTTPVAVHSTESGDQLIASNSSNGKALGVTVAPDLSWVRISSPTAADAKGATASDGLLRVSSPIELRILKDSKLLGTVPGAALKLPAGRHKLELVNQTLGYRLAQTVDVIAGQTLSIHVAPEHGWVLFNSTPPADVLIDGERIGRTPLGPLPLALGDHAVVFQHASGARDVQRVKVASGATVRLIGYPRR